VDSSPGGRQDAPAFRPGEIAEVGFAKLARAHSKVRDARRDFLHQTSTDLVRRFDAIAIEDLAVANMVRNRRLAKAISRTGWAEFRTLRGTSWSPPG
jgi:Probable transposase